MAPIILLLLVARPASALPDRSLRIGTFNLAFVPSGASNPTMIAAQMGDAAAEYAERIKNSGYDVIALNEVFDDGPREILKDNLIRVYPYVIYLVDGSNSLQEQDSGLMLFSKLPFRPLNPVWDNTAGECNPCEYYFGGPGKLAAPDVAIVASPEYIAFYEYRNGGPIAGEMCFDNGAIVGPECNSEKGVAYVRVRNPESGRIHNIFFTHMQHTGADWSSAAWRHARDVRDRQMQLVQFMFDLARTPAVDATRVLDPTQEDVFVIGDLNIEGDVSNPAVGWANPWNNRVEWCKYFGGCADFAGDPDWNPGFTNGSQAAQLEDRWHHDNPPKGVGVIDPHSDYGNTVRDEDCYSESPSPAGNSSSEGCRFDYILGNHPYQPLCTQQLTVGYNLFYGGTTAGKTGVHSGGRAYDHDGLLATPPVQGTGLGGQQSISDHIAVSADLNGGRYPRCSPLDPAVADVRFGVPPEGGSYGAYEMTNADLGATIDNAPNFLDPGWMKSGRIRYKGNVQWYKIPETRPGVYLIGFWTGNTGFSVDVFQAHDMSRPVASFGEDTFNETMHRESAFAEISGKKYVLNDPPYYLKVYHDNHAQEDAPYYLGVKRLRCTSRDAACPLLPNEKSALYQFNPNGPVNAEDSLYFEVRPERLWVQDHVAGHDADTQSLSFFITDQVQDSIDLRVERADGTLLWSTGNGGCGCGLPGITCGLQLLNRQFSAPQNEDDRVLYLLARRAPICGAQFPSVPFKTFWKTDVNVLYGTSLYPGPQPFALTCVSTEDSGDWLFGMDINSDEIGFRIEVDGHLAYDSSPSSWQFDEPEVRRLDGIFTAEGLDRIYFRSQVHIEVKEIDPFSSQTMQGDILPLSTGLGKRSLETPVKLRLSVDAARYWFTATQSHGLPWAP